MNRRFEGLTYTWSFPENVTGRQNDAFPNRAAAQVLFAGEYDVTRDHPGYARPSNRIDPAHCRRAGGAL